MKLGIIQTDPSDPDSLQIVNQETGERVENVSWCEMEYNLDGTQTIKAEFKVFRKPKQNKVKLSEKALDSFMKDSYKKDSLRGIQTSPNPFDQAREHHPV